jgi:hypothetical protein
VKARSKIWWLALPHLKLDSQKWLRTGTSTRADQIIHRRIFAFSTPNWHYIVDTQGIVYISWAIYQRNLKKMIQSCLPATSLRPAPRPRVRYPMYNRRSHYLVLPLDYLCYARNGTCSLCSSPILPYHVVVRTSGSKLKLVLELLTKWSFEWWNLVPC